MSRLFQQRFKVANAPLQRLYECARFMLRWVRNDKVFGTVIVADAVDVMHMLRGGQLAPKHARHNDAMFKHVALTVSAHEDVSILAHESSTLPIRIRITAFAGVVTSLAKAHVTEASETVKDGSRRQPNGLGDHMRRFSSVVSVPQHAGVYRLLIDGTYALILWAHRYTGFQQSVSNSAGGNGEIGGNLLQRLAAQVGVNKRVGLDFRVMFWHAHNCITVVGR